MSEEQLEDVRTHVFEALGAASTCWESMEGTGVFDDARAKQTGDDLVAYLREQFDKKVTDNARLDITGAIWAALQQRHRDAGHPSGAREVTAIVVVIPAANHAAHLDVGVAFGIPVAIIPDLDQRGVAVTMYEAH